jgi:hypothetical protein
MMGSDRSLGECHSLRGEWDRMTDDGLGSTTWIHSSREEWDQPMMESIDHFNFTLQRKSGIDR